MIPLADISINIDAVAGVIALVTAISLFSVAIWRIGSLEHRVDQLESQDRSHSDRMAVVETKLESIEDLCRQIVEKLNAP